LTEIKFNKMRYKWYSFLIASVIIMVQWHSTQAADYIYDLPENTTSSFDHVVAIFDKWGPDWRIEWIWRVVSLAGPDDPKRPDNETGRPWKGYENKCVPSVRLNTTECPRGWYCLWHFTKFGSPLPNIDREPGVFLHWNGKQWLMRVDLSEPYLNETIDHASWDYPDLEKKLLKEGDRVNLTFEQVIDEAKPGVNMTSSKFKIWSNGVDQKVGIPSRFVPRAAMQLYWSDRWHLPAGEVIIKTEKFRVWYSKEWNVDTAFDCYLRADFKLGMNETVKYEQNGTGFAEDCTVPAYGMFPQNGTFLARKAGKYYFTFTAAIRVEDHTEYQLEMVKWTLVKAAPKSNQADRNETTVIATIGLNQDIDSPVPTPAPTKAPNQRDGIKKVEVRSKIMNAVAMLDANDQVYVRVAKQEKPGNYLVAENLGTHFVGIQV